MKTRSTLIGLLALVLSGCGSGPTLSTAGQTLTAPNFNAIYTEILEPQCVRCHYTQNPRGGVSVSTYAELMASPGAVSPFQPWTSQVYYTCYNGSMPRNSNDGPNKPTQNNRLSDADLQSLYNWIAVGAPNR